MSNILVIDDDEFMRNLISTLLKKAGHEVTIAKDGEEGLRLLKKNEPDLILTDYKMPGITGIDVVEQAESLYPGLPVIILTGYGATDLTIKAIQAGAYDYIEKPVRNQELLEVVENGLKAHQRSKSLKAIINPAARKEIEDNLMAGKTPAMREIFKNIGHLSMNTVNVIVTGEPGTGKEQIARLIHFSGINRDHPFEVIQCNGISENLLHDEMFGYINSDGKVVPGKLETAGKGTVFMGEFRELPHNLQNKLLIALEQQLIARPDGNTTPFQARLVCGSSIPEGQAVEDKEFLQELLYRLRLFVVHLPPLRDRLEDIDELSQIILTRLNYRLNKKISKIEDGVLNYLKNYSWPGNIRELENVLTQAAILAHSDVLELGNIPVLPGITHPKGLSNFGEDLLPMHKIEKIHIHKILEATHWNKVRASEILEITRPTLNNKIKRYGLVPTVPKKRSRYIKIKDRDKTQEK
ncbi:MAG: sigma-54-dependent Fis family transcriptional regulator [Clostridia bacterium]|nr:sigma-54-dependent Fis family transcriptional regulator [Clostridia bacterium]